MVWVIALFGCTAGAQEFGVAESHDASIKPDAKVSRPSAQPVKPDDGKLDAGVSKPDAELDIYDPTMHPDFVGC